jgi:hypothetical protein
MTIAQRTSPSRASVHPSPTKEPRGPRLRTGQRADRRGASPSVSASRRPARYSTRSADDLESPSIWAGVAITARTQGFPLRDTASLPRTRTRRRTSSRSLPRRTSGVATRWRAAFTNRQMRASRPPPQSRSRREIAQRGALASRSFGGCTRLSSDPHGRGRPLAARRGMRDRLRRQGVGADLDPRRQRRGERVATHVVRFQQRPHWRRRTTSSLLCSTTDRVRVQDSRCPGARKRPAMAAG